MLNDHVPAIWLYRYSRSSLVWSGPWTLFQPASGRTSAVALSSPPRSWAKSSCERVFRKGKEVNIRGTHYAFGGGLAIARVPSEVDDLSVG